MRSACVGALEGARDAVADFTHLHVHSEYSLLDGQSRLQRLVEATKAGGMSALALTDHGVMYGALDFYKACLEGGIKPIIGVEGYSVPSLQEKTGRYEYNHLLLLASDNTGYHNLLKLTTLAHTRGYQARPRMDRKMLEQYSGGLIATSGCISGEIPELLLRGDLNGARAAARWYQDVFGPESFYIEIQDHGAPESPQNQLNPLLYDLAREVHAPLLATNDLHYVAASDAEAQDVLLCVQTGKTLEDPKRMKFDSSQYYLKTPDEMAALFPELPDALRNSMEIAERCNVTIEPGASLIPSYEIPPEFASQDEYLYHLCQKGVRELYGELTDELKQRLDYEFEVIRSKGFVSYFLIVWDYVNFARSNGMRCVARGSAAGSLVAYSLGITNVDPIRYELLFERFLNPERMSMPDIDMDFPDDRRDEVIRYVAEKYGWDKVAQIVTFNTMAAKAAVRDVGRVMGMQAEADRVARLIPGGPKVTIRGALDEVRELKQLYDQSPPVRKLVDVARDLEGTVRGSGIHAAGVVISREPLDQTVPLQLRDYKDPNDTWLVSQYEQAHLEELGLIKFDFLGLANLSILMNCRAFIKQTRGIDIDLDRLPTDDAKTYALLAEGETTGVFQLESGAMRTYIKDLKPTCIEDVTAMVALYRPGPMDSIPQFIRAKHGEVQIRYLHPSLEPLLRDSYGVIVYQDQVLLIAVQLAGFSWGEVDKFRKAMSKKNREQMLEYRGKFIKGCAKNGIPEKTAEEIFSFIEPFAGYGFNKSHAAAYGFVAYQTAYLKANYTAEFMAATLTAVASDAGRVVSAVEECRRMGVEVLPPDINHSESGFTVEKLEPGEDGRPRWGVRFGLVGIRNVGSRPVEELLAARRADGPFISLADVFARTDSKNLARSAVECLIKAGALDSMGSRSRLLAGLERAMSYGQQKRRMREIGQNSLFGGLDGASGADDFVLPDAPEHSQQQLLAWEKELLNLYLSAHPLAHVAPFLKKRVTGYSAHLTEEWAGQKVTLGGRVISSRRIVTRRGDTMLAVQFEDLLGSLEIIVFSRTYAATQEVWKDDAILLVTGQVKMRDDQPQLVAEEVEAFAVTEEEASRRTMLVRIHIQRGKNTSVDVTRAQDVLTALNDYPGDDQVELWVRNGVWEARIPAPSGRLGVRFCPELLQQIERALGPNTVEAVPLA
ncbi:MAG TPA: DNA polymerase III subunit alpha [Ktedonobacterales bacterium]|nr:DNA polymerase III subunit alpha [Ktedonobacterales bacterium]